VADANVTASELGLVFGSLQVLRGSLNVFFNPSVADMTWLTRLVEVTGSLLVQFNSGLLSLDGLEQLSRVGGDVSVVQNERMADACALFPVTVDGTFDIALNAHFVRVSLAAIACLGSGALRHCFRSCLFSGVYSLHGFQPYHLLLNLILPAVCFVLL
jgi:hypothetical protein